MYFGPASQFARVGAAVHRVHGEDFLDCADRLQGQDDVKDLLKNVPDEGWFVRTDSCSPKDSDHDGGVGPHYDLQSILLAVAGSNRCQKSLRMENYEQDLSLYVTPFDPKVRTSRELRVFVYHGKNVCELCIVNKKCFINDTFRSCHRNISVCMDQSRLRFLKNDR